MRGPAQGPTPCRAITTTHEHRAVSVIEYRAFRNGDSPALAEIWRARARERGLMQTMSAQLLEQFVFSKPYFDNDGLIVAVDDSRLVGFVHAGFGATEDEKHLSTDMGVTCMLMVGGEHRRLGIGTELLAHSERYLRGRGAQVLYGGGIAPLNPFYLGLYGGSELPGVLNSDEAALQLYESRGYQAIDHTVILQRHLSDFRPPVDRRQLQLRRTTKVHISDDPPSATWWGACTYGGFARTRFDLMLSSTGESAARVTFWEIEPLSSSWGVRTVGLIDLEVREDCRRQGYATALVSEALRELQTVGFGAVEVQTMQANQAALDLYAKLGFNTVDGGTVFRKEATA